MSSALKLSAAFTRKAVMMRISHRHVPVMACLLFVPSDLPKLRADLIVDSGVNESQADQPVSFALLGTSTSDLLYNPSNGNVVMDASEASGATITNFVLKNAPGGAGFVTGVAIFPFTSIFTTDTVTEISQTDGTAVGLHRDARTRKRISNRNDQAAVGFIPDDRNLCRSFGNGCP